MSDRNINDPTRALPSSLDMEKGVLSCMLQAPEWAISKALGVVKDSHFHSPANAIVFRLLRDMHRDGVGIDPMIVQQALMDQKLMDSIGGPAAIAEIYTFAPSPAQVATYAAEVRDKATLRNVIKVCMDGAAMAFDQQDDATGVLRSVENRIMTLREYEDGGGHTLSGKEALFRTCDALEAQMMSQTPDGVPWGFRELDEKTGGICPGLTLIGAETSGGKSVLAMQAAIALLRAGKTVDLYSLEMPIDLCVRRMLCYLSRLNFGRLRNPIPQFNHGEHTDFQRACREFSQFADRLTICADGSKTASGILSDIRQKQAAKNTDAVVVDYIQRLMPEDPRATAEQQISDASRTFKRLADALNIAVITPVQLNDSGLVRGSRMLTMDCDTYIKIIHEKDKDGSPVDTDDHGRRRCMLYVEKNRNGERWFGVDSFLDGAKMAFSEAA
jgi:replicative DNA helicase